MTPTRTGLLASFLTGLACACLWWMASFPSLFYMAWIVVFPGFVLLAGGLVVLRGALGHAGDRWMVLQLGLAIAVGVGAAAGLPLRLGFSLVRPALEAGIQPGDRVGPYRFVAGRTADYCGTPGIDVYRMDAGRGAFVHAPAGLDGYCYNSGTTGALGGDWYFSVDD